MSKAVKAVEDILATFLPENDMMLWNVEFVKEGREWFLRVFIDRTDGGYISTDDCEMVSVFLSEKLDETDPIEHEYYLEVSSPGLDRTLIKKSHFDSSIGMKVDISLYRPLRDLPEIREGALAEHIAGDIPPLNSKTFTAELLEYIEGVDAEKLAISGPALRLMLEIDKGAKNRKPGAKIGKNAIERLELVLPLSDVSKVKRTLVF